MQEIGQQLAEARKRLGLTLEEVERSTRIRAHHLRALEQGELDSLPSLVQVQGFLRNYADFLGLPTDSILEQYRAALQAQSKGWPRRRQFHELPTQPVVRVRSRRPTWLTADLFIAAAITLVVVGLIAWGVGRLMASMRERTLAAQGPAAFLIPTFTPSPAPLEAEALPSPPIAELSPAATASPGLASSALIGPAAAPVDLRLLIERRSWLRVIVDGQQVFQGRAAPGEILEFQGQSLIELTTGNGAGLRVFFNGQDQGPLGELSQVVVRLWTPQGAITPTPTITPTQPTPTSTATPQVFP